MQLPQQSNYCLVGPVLVLMAPLLLCAAYVGAIRVMCIDPSLAYALSYIDPHFQVDEALYRGLGE
jgi:hypothetical protein